MTPKVNKLVNAYNAYNFLDLRKALTLIVIINLSSVVYAFVRAIPYSKLINSLPYFIILTLLSYAQ